MKTHTLRSLVEISLLALLLLMVTACSQAPSPTPAATAAATQTPLLSPTSPPSDTPQPSLTPTATHTRTPTATATSTRTPAPEFSSTPEITATPQGIQAEVLEQANCRYGPSSAYLYSHGLYPGDRVAIDGRNYSGSWLWIKPENLERHCWAAASVMEISGDPREAPVVQTKLPQSTLYGPPSSVEAVRDGDQVLVAWERVWMTEDDDRGYLIEATVCQNGNRIPVAVQTDENFYQFTDEQSCSEASGGKLYTVEKHGYTTPIDIPWP